MKMNSKTLSIAVLTAGLTGCVGASPALQGRLDAHLGDSIRANTEVHAVAPTPEQKANTFIPPDPDVMQRARQAYKDGMVKKPRSVNP